jgi:putative PIN family toxin of toxin-antitoxin system
MMAVRVVADTNVYVSVLQFGGRLSDILDFADDGTIELCISEAILDELAGVLARKFGWEPERVKGAAASLAELCRMVRPQVTVRAAPDADDDAVLECALAAGADVIVSGDGHLLGMESFRGIPIMSPRRFFDWVETAR